MTRFQVAAGSVAGREHRRTGRNNQDAFCWCPSGDDGVIAVVADGCGSGAHSEIGARLGVRLVAEALRVRAGQSLAPADLLDAVRRDVLGRLHAVVVAMGGRLEITVEEHFLFTVVGAVWTADGGFVFGAGDGVYATDGDVQVVTSPDNAPAYIGYGLVDGPDAGPALTVWRPITADARSVLVGSDGLAGLDARAFAALSGDDVFANPHALTRRLTLLGQQLGGAHALGAVPPLSDDATVVVVRRAPEEQP